MTSIDDQDEPGREAAAAPIETAPAAGKTGPDAAPVPADAQTVEAAATEEVAPAGKRDDSETEIAASGASRSDDPAVDNSVDESSQSAPSGSQADAGADTGFDAPVVKSAEDNGDLVLDLDGYEGPIDVLLTLARDQKVDLKKISILELADQYLAFVARARRLRLELAADYLVMAAWLAYLKSRLLLPEPPKDGEPSGAEMAAALAFQLQRLAAMQKAGQALLALPQLNRDFFRRGEPEAVRLIQVPVYNLTLYELLKAYGTHPGRKREGVLHIEPLRLFSMDDALHRIGDLIGHKLDWTILRDFLPEEMQLNPLQRRAALAATFAASLELARSGRVQLRQDGTFGPIYLKAGIPRDWDAPENDGSGGDDGSDGGSSNGGFGGEPENDLSIGEGESPDSHSSIADEPYVEGDLNDGDSHIGDPNNRDPDNSDTNSGGSGIDDDNAAQTGIQDFNQGSHA